MQRQQQAEGELIQVYRSLIAVILIALLLGIFGYRYFADMNQIMGQRGDLAYNRLLNVLVMVRSQWLAYGKPKEMELDWKVFDSNTMGKLSNVSISSRVKMSDAGRPLPETKDATGCRKLWYQLMGQELQKQLVVEFHLTEQSCYYKTKSLDSISYQLTTGRVLYVPKPHN